MDAPATNGRTPRLAFAPARFLAAANKLNPRSILSAPHSIVRSQIIFCALLWRCYMVYTQRLLEHEPESALARLGSWRRAGSAGDASIDVLTALPGERPAFGAFPAQYWTCVGFDIKRALASGAPVSVSDALSSASVFLFSYALSIATLGAITHPQNADLARVVWALRLRIEVLACLERAARGGETARASAETLRDGIKACGPPPSALIVWALTHDDMTLQRHWAQTNGEFRAKSGLVVRGAWECLELRTQMLLLLIPQCEAGSAAVGADDATEILTDAGLIASLARDSQWVLKQASRLRTHPHEAPKAPDCSERAPERRTRKRKARSAAAGSQAHTHARTPPVHRARRTTRRPVSYTEDRSSGSGFGSDGSDREWKLEEDGDADGKDNSNINGSDGMDGAPRHSSVLARGSSRARRSHRRRRTLAASLAVQSASAAATGTVPPESLLLALRRDGWPVWSRLILLMSLRLRLLDTCAVAARSRGCLDNFSALLDRCRCKESEGQGGATGAVPGIVTGNGGHLARVVAWLEGVVRGADDAVLALLALRLCSTLCSGLRKVWDIGALAFRALHEAYPAADAVAMAVAVPPPRAATDLAERSLLRCAASVPPPLIPHYVGFRRKLRRTVERQRAQSASTAAASMQVRRFMWACVGMSPMHRAPELFRSIFRALAFVLKPKRAEEKLYLPESRVQEVTFGAHPKMRALAEWNANIVFPAMCLCAAMLVCQAPTDTSAAADRFRALRAAVGLLSDLAGLIVMRVPAMSTKRRNQSKNTNGMGIVSARTGVHPKAAAESVDAEAETTVHPLLLPVLRPALKTIADVCAALKAKLEIAIEAATAPRDDETDSKRAGSTMEQLSPCLQCAQRLVERVTSVHAVVKGCPGKRKSLPGLVLKHEGLRRFLERRATTYHVNLDADAPYSCGEPSCEERPTPQSDLFKKLGDEEKVASGQDEQAVDLDGDKTPVDQDDEDFESDEDEDCEFGVSENSGGSGLAGSATEYGSDSDGGAGGESTEEELS